MVNPDHLEENIARLMKTLADQPVQVDAAFHGRLRACLHAEAGRLALPWWRRLFQGEVRVPRRWGLAAAFATVVVVTAVVIGVLIGLSVMPSPDQPALLTVRNGSVVVRQIRSSLLGVTRETTRTLKVGESLKLAQGDRVIAGPDAQAVLSYPDERWSELDAGADVTLAVIQPTTEAAPFHVLLQVWAGPTHHHVERPLEADERFEVETTAGVASVRSGDFHVTVVSANHTYLATDKGVVSVVVPASGQTAEVPPGYQVNILLDQPLQVRPRPPELTGISMAQDAKLRLTGQAVAGATLLLYAREQEAVRFTADGQGRFWHVFAAPAEGVYRLQLAAVGADGQVSDLSAPLVWVYDPALSVWFRLADPAPKEESGALRMRLAGQVEPGARVMVNGTPARIATDGSFELEVELETGRNVLAFSVTGSAGERTSLELEVLLVRDADSADFYVALIPQETDRPPVPTAKPGFAMTKFAPALVNPGQVLTYTLVVQNHTGITPATTVVTDVLPAGTDFGAASHGGVESDGVVTWMIPNLAHGATVTRTLRVTVTTSDLAIINDAYGVNGGSDWITTTLGQAVTVGVPQLLIAKHGPESVGVGQVFSYTLTITNHTSDALDDLVISDVLPAGVRYKSSNPPGAWLSASRTLVWNVASLPCSGELPVHDGRQPGGAGRCQGSDAASLSLTIVVTAPDTVAVVANSDYAVRASNWPRPSRGAPVFTTVGDYVPIYSIQGRDFRSPMVGETVKTVGVVAGFVRGNALRGFYVQAPDGDGDEVTSDGILIRHSVHLTPAVQVGDLVTVTGRVGEFSERGGFLCSDEMCETQIYIGNVAAVKVGENVDVPSAVELNPPGDLRQAAAYWESREGMLVTLPSTATVVGSASHGIVMVVRGDLGVERVMHTGPYAGMPVGVRTYRGYGAGADDLTVGSVIENVDGPLAYVRGNYVVITQPDDAWQTVYRKPTPAQAPSWPQASGDAFSVATFNTLDFDTASGAKMDKVVTTVVRLGCPTFLALEEIDVETVMPNLLSNLRLKGCSYNYAHSHADVSGRGVALLWRAGRVSNVTWSTRYQSCSADGSSSARYDPLWDDCQGLGADVYPLFSRRPVVLTATVSLDGDNLPLVVIANHFKSRLGGASAKRGRLEQGRFVARLVDDWAAWPYVIVLGDLNDLEGSPPLKALYAGDNLVNTWYTLPAKARYTYIHQGISQARDHILVSPALMAMLQDAGPLHYNADYPYAYGSDGDVVWRTSAHDPVAATFAWTGLSITKTVETVHTPVHLGDSVTYTLVLANQDDEDAAAVAVTDVLPPGVSGDNLNWRGVISTGEQVEFTVQAVVTTNPAFCGQTIENTAVYSYTGVRGSSSARFTLERAPAPSLTLVKTVELLHEPVRPGDPVTYTVLVANNGGQIVSGVALTDVLPPEVDFAAWVVSPPRRTTVVSDVMTWRGSVGAGEVITWIFRANVTGAYGAVVVNTATLEQNGDVVEDSVAFAFEPQSVSSLIVNEIMQNPAVVSDSDGEWIELYNAGNDSVDVNGCTLRDDDGDLHVIDDGGPLIVNPGEYLVLGNNADPTTNGGVAVAYVYTDLILANGADQVILECDGHEVDRVDYDGGTHFPDPAGASMQLVNPASDNNVGANWCEATTAWPGSSGDAGTPGAVNDCPSPDLFITKTVTPPQARSGAVSLGAALTYTIVIANNGNAEAIGVRVMDVLPPGVVGTDLDQTVNLAPGDRKTFVIPVTVATDATYYGQTIANVAYYYHTSRSGLASASFDVEPAQREPRLAITKTVEILHSPVYLGDPVAYTIVVANDGNGAATGVVISDELPLGLSLGGCMGNECTARFLPPGNTVSWEPDVLPAGARYTIRFIATLTTSAAFCGEVVTNSVTYTSADAGSGADGVAFVVESLQSSLPITLAAEAARVPVHLGDPITYTIVVANRRDEDASGMVITDDLPSGVIGANLHWTGTVTAHEQVEFILPAVVITDTAYYGQTIVNTAYYSHASGSGFGAVTLPVYAPYSIFLPTMMPGGPDR